MPRPNDAHRQPREETSDSLAGKDDRDKPCRARVESREEELPARAVAESAGVAGYVDADTKAVVPERRTPLITKDTFQVPLLIIRDNSEDYLAEKEEFSAKLAEMASEQLEWLDETLAADTHLRREIVLNDLFMRVMKWRMDLAKQGLIYNSDSSSDKANLVHIRSAPFDRGFDTLGAGWWTNGAVVDPVTMQWLPGITTPSSEQLELLGRRVKLLFKHTDENKISGLHPDPDVVHRAVRLPDGDIVSAGTVNRGAAAYREMQWRMDGDVHPQVQEWVDICGVENTDHFPLLAVRHADLWPRMRIWTAAGSELADMLGASKTADSSPPDPQRFANAVYLMYAGNLPGRGGDAIIRAMTAILYTKIFGRPPNIPHDLDTRTWWTPQHKYSYEIAAELARPIGSSPRTASAD